MRTTKHQAVDGLDLSPWIDSYMNLAGIWSAGLEAVAKAQIDSWKLGQYQMHTGMEMFRSIFHQSMESLAQSEQQDSH